MEGKFRKAKNSSKRHSLSNKRVKTRCVCEKARRRATKKRQKKEREIEMREQECLLAELLDDVVAVKGGGGSRNDATPRALVLAPRDVGTSSKQLFL